MVGNGRTKSAERRFHDAAAHGSGDRRVQSGRLVDCRNQSGRHALAFKIDHFFDSGPINHDLKAGAQFEYNYYQGLSAVPSGVVYQDANGAPSQASYAGPSELGATYTQRGGWVEDQISSAG